MRLFPLVLALALACGACARRAPVPEDCPRLYALLPGNFIVDVAAGAHVTLNPAAGEFALFCSPAGAAKALEAAKLPGDWRVYSLKGNFAEIAETAEDGQIRLAAPAEVEDWVE